MNSVRVIKTEVELKALHESVAAETEVRCSPQEAGQPPLDYLLKLDPDREVVALYEGEVPRAYALVNKRTGRINWLALSGMHADTPVLFVELMRYCASHYGPPHGHVASPVLREMMTKGAPVKIEGTIVTWLGP